MSVSVQIDDVRMRDALNRLASLGLDGGRILRVEGRKLIREIVALTPPSGGKSRVSQFATIDVNARKQGELAVSKDLANIFDVLSDSTHDYVKRTNKAQFPRAISIWQSGSNKRVIDIDHLGTSIDEMRAFHQRLRSKATGRTPILRRHREDGLGRWKSYERMVVSKSMLARYKREVHGQVGKLKGGWAAAAAALDVRLPAWVSRHSSGNCTAQLGRGDSPFIYATNNQKGSASKTKSIVAWAMRKRASAIRTNVARMIKHGAGKSGDYGYAEA